MKWISKVVLGWQQQNYNKWRQCQQVFFTYQIYTIFYLAVTDKFLGIIKFSWTCGRLKIAWDLTRVNVLPKYVAKTCAHLSTYSRKSGNYNDTIIFEIDIMKKSTQSIKIFVKCFVCFVCYCYSCNCAEHKVSVTLKRSVILVLTVAKNVNFKLSGENFFMISVTKIMVPL